MEENKKYVNMALLIVTTVIIVLTAFMATHVVYNFATDTAPKKEITNETFSNNNEYEYEYDYTEVVDTVS